MKSWKSICLLLAVVSGIAQAQEDSLLIGGVTVSDGSTYSYLGIINPVGEGSVVGDGWFLSYIASYLTYEYDSALVNPVTQVDVSAPGFDLGLGHAWSGDGYWLNLSLAAGQREFQLSPDIAAEEPRGSVSALTAQLQWDKTIATNTNLNLLSSYSIGPNSSFNRLRFATGRYDGWRLGPEFVYQRGRNYRLEQFGLMFYRQAGEWNWELGGGVSENKAGDSGSYLTLAFVKPF